MMTETIKQQVLRVRATGRTNMFDLRMVKQVATELGCDELVEFLQTRSNQEVYVQFILTGKFIHAVGAKGTDGAGSEAQTAAAVFEIKASFKSRFCIRFQLRGGNDSAEPTTAALVGDGQIVGAEGGEMIIPVTSTGVDNVEVIFNYFDRWEVDDENGDLTPQEGWIEIVKVINEYDADKEATRALAMYESAIVVKVLPNDTGYGRSATLSAQSFTVSDRIIIRQPAAGE
jgi:hypothetical protein